MGDKLKDPYAKLVLNAVYLPSPTSAFTQFYNPSIAEGITRDGQKKLRELQAMLCPPNQFAWCNDGKAECVKCGKVGL